MEILFSQPHPGCQWSRQDGSDGLSKIQTWDGSDLIELRLDAGLPMHLAEKRFFGGPRDFKRNFLKKIIAKELR